MAEPIQKIEAWPLDVAVWRNERVAEGSVRHFYSATLQRTYKTDSGYAHTDSLNEDDLLLASKLLNEAHSAILRLKAADYAKRQQARTP